MALEAKDIFLNRRDTLLVLDLEEGEGVYMAFWLGIGMGDNV